jgi:hypothetical protein
MKSKIEALKLSGSEEIIDKIKERVRQNEYNDNTPRVDSIDYIAAKVKGQIAPILRLARQVRRGYYPKWVEFNELLDYFGVKDILTRENNYSPMPERVLNHWDSFRSLELENHIFFFNQLHEMEDKRYEEIFEFTFEKWARPSLKYALSKVDISKSEKEIVRYVCKTFYTKYIELRATSQGMNRKYREGKWVYYYTKGINEDDFRYNEVMRTIFHGNDDQKYKEIDEMARLLTKRQTKLLIQLHDYVREDVRNLDNEQFYNKYPHGKMNYKSTCEKLGYNYHGFVKNIERMKRRVV